MTANASYYGEEVITLLFRVDRTEEREALGVFRAGFGAAADLEALTEDVMVLHVRPGHPGCPCDEGTGSVGP